MKNTEEQKKTMWKQIDERQYDTILISKGYGPGQICKYGVGFKGKTVLIS